MIKKKRNRQTGQTRYVKTVDGKFLKIKLGDSLLFSFRIENYYKLLTNKMKRIGAFTVSSEKLRHDNIKYAYCFLTGKTRMIVRKLTIDKFYFIRSIKLSERSHKDLYEFSFKKSEPFFKDYEKDVFVDSKYVFSKEIDKLKTLGLKDLKNRLSKYSYIKHKRHNTTEKEVIKIREKLLRIISRK